jgi:FKBP-type peptidyl-prolyl cis-trans isomerase FklB
MKNLKNAGIFLLILFVIQACSTGSFKSEKVASKTDSVSYMLGLSIGHSFKTEAIPGIKPALIAKGIEEAENGDTTVSENQINMFLSTYFRQMQQEKADKNLKEGEAFLATNKTKPGIITTASGLQYKVIQEGTGASPKGNDMVKCQYKLKTITGAVIQSSYESGEPAQFPLNGVIKGWTEGLQYMKEGGKYELYVPAQLGYGERGAGKNIAPNSVLVFEMELLQVTPQAADAKGKH